METGKPHGEFSMSLEKSLLDTQVLISGSEHLGDLKKMRVAFYVYPTAFQAPGGGEVQLMKTKEYLEKKGVEVKLFDPWVDKLGDFDILHTFGSVKDCLDTIRTAKILGVKIVLSTICWYSWRSAWGIYSSWDQRMLSIARQVAKSLVPFMPSRRKQMMDHSDILYPNSQTEAEQLVRYFCVPREKVFIVPNGVDSKFLEATPDLFMETYGLKDFILCVGRIEPRKNQLNMIRALKNLNIPVVFIGDYVHHYDDYYVACRKEAEGNMYFLEPIPHESELLASAYAACNTFLLASWLETPGLAVLEAALAGAKVVITDQGATREYFSDYASYVPPNDLNAIRKKTLKAFNAPTDLRLKEHIRSHFLWEHTVDKTLEGYLRILKNGR